MDRSDLETETLISTLCDWMYEPHYGVIFGNCVMCGIRKFPSQCCVSTMQRNNTRYIFNRSVCDVLQYVRQIRYKEKHNMKIWSNNSALNMHVEHNSNTCYHFNNSYMRNHLIWKQKRGDSHYSGQRHSARLCNNICIYVAGGVSVRYIPTGSIPDINDLCLPE